MKILFVHEVSYRTKFVFEMHEFPELLAKDGHEVCFIEFAEDYDSWKPKLATRSTVIRGRVCQEVAIRLYTPGRFGTGIFGRLIATLTTPFALRRAIQENHPDVIVLYAVPTSGWQTVIQAQRSNIPVVFRALDVSHKIRPTRFAPLVRAAERFIYKRADVLSANNPAMAEYCNELSGRTRLTVVNLPPLELSAFEGIPSREVLRQFDFPEDAKIIIYMGSFFRFSGLDDCLIHFSKHARKNPKLRFLLVGAGELDLELRSLSESLGLQDAVVFTGVVPYSKLGIILRAADVAINPFNSQLLTNVALPHKVFQYMASGVPVVSTSLEGIRGVLGDECGVTWVENSEKVIDAAVALLEESEIVRSDIGRRQLSRVRNLFDPEAIVESIEGTLVQAVLAARDKILG